MYKIVECIPSNYNNSKLSSVSVLRNDNLNMFVILRNYSHFRAITLLDEYKCCYPSSFYCVLAVTNFFNYLSNTDDKTLISDFFNNDSVSREKRLFWLLEFEYASKDLDTNLYKIDE